jgi:hypothetical protein
MSVNAVQLSQFKSCSLLGITPPENMLISETHLSRQPTK